MFMNVEISFVLREKKKADLMFMSEEQNKKEVFNY